MRNFFTILFLFFSAKLCAQESITLVPHTNSILTNEQYSLESARRSLEFGMPVLSRVIAQRLANSENPKYKNEAQLLILDSLIAEGKFESAKKELEKFEGRKSDELDLCRAIVLLRTSDENTEALLSKINISKLSETLRPWYYMTKGMQAFDKGDFNAALSNVAKAKSETKIRTVLAEIEVFEKLCRISAELGAEDLQSLSEDLALKTSLYLGTPTGVQFVKQYAIVLDRLGRKKEALEVLDTQLEVSLLSAADKDELRLIYAYLDSSLERKRSTLTLILRTTTMPEVTEQAIYLLRYVSDMDGVDSAPLLTGVLDAASPLIKDRILLELASLSLRKNNFEDVQKYSKKLLNDYPASRYTIDAYRFLAYSAFSSENKKSEYSLAASYMAKVSQLEKNPESADTAKFISADCYFFDKDYGSAAAIYGQLIDSNLDDLWKSIAFSRAAESLIYLKKIPEAIALADKAYAGISKVSPEEIWKTEWLIANSYKENADFANAGARIEKLLAGPVSASADNSLRARLLWLQARISENAGELDRALMLADNLIKIIAENKLSFSQEAKDLISSNTMLMRSRILMLLDRSDAFASYDNLRELYPQSDAAQLSYLYEARNLDTRDAHLQAQQLCKTLVDVFPQSRYADLALYDAATYSKKLGLESDLKDALALLKRLIEEYPNSGKVFYAKLAQVAILRQLGDFANAVAIYKNMLSDFANHPEIIAVQMGMADCFLAIPNRESDAIAIFEKLYSTPEIPPDAKAEVAFHWGFALEKNGRKHEAAEIWWISSNDFLKTQEAFDEKNPKTEISAKQRYWISRSLMQLARVFESEKEVRSAISAYELLIKYDLMGAYVAKGKLLNLKNK